MLTADQIFLAARLMYQTGQMNDILGAPSCQGVSPIIPTKPENCEIKDSVRVHVVFAKHKKTREVSIMQLESITEDPEWEELS